MIPLENLPVRWYSVASSLACQRCVAGLIALSTISTIGCTTGVAQESWVQAAKKDWALSVKVTGELKASHSDAIGPPQLSEGGQYKIARMVAEGTRVKKGEEVVAFDTSDLEQRLLQRRNARDLSVAEIERHRSDTAIRRRDDKLAIAECQGAVRKAALKANGSADLFSSLELQTARLDHDLAVLRLQYRTEKAEAATRKNRDDLRALRDKKSRAEARLEKIEGYIQRMSVRAPRDATVIYLANWQGQKKKVGDGVWRGENILQTAATDQMLAAGQVAEADISQLAVSQRITLRLDAYPDAEYSGRIQAIGNLVGPPSAESPLRIAEVDIALDKAQPLSLRPGMRFSGQIETETIAGALLIPLNTVFVRDTHPIAYLRTGGGFRRVSLKLGRTLRGQVRVLDGLSEGDEVSTVDLQPESPG